MTKWGAGPDAGEGDFTVPIGIITNATGHVFITAYGNHRVQVFTTTGQFVTKWGTEGTGDGQFYYPTGIAFNATGEIYIVEGRDLSNQSRGHRVQVFTPTGQFLTKWGMGGHGYLNQFYTPFAIAINSTGHEYVSDSANDRVLIFGSGYPEPPEDFLI